MYLQQNTHQSTKHSSYYPCFRVTILNLFCSSDPRFHLSNNYSTMHLELLFMFILLTSTVDIVSPYKKHSKGMLMDLDYLVSQLYLQHCTFVEIGEGVCSLFVELPTDVSCQQKRSLKKQLYFGNCLCSEFRKWQLCSRQLTQERPEDCVFEEGVTCPSSSARVHRRLCDVTGMSQWNPQCNCSVTQGYMPQESLCGFRTCYVSPLPSAVCSPRSVCGTAHCNTSRHGALYSVRCDRKCKDHQPFCERVGPETSVRRRVESQWSAWRPASDGDDGQSIVQQAVTECVGPQGSPAFDCLGPGLLCCTGEEGDCICEVKLEDGHLKAFRYAITFSQSNSLRHNSVKVRSAATKGQLNVWNRFLDIAREDGSDSLFARPKVKVNDMAIVEKSYPAIGKVDATTYDQANLKTVTANGIIITTTDASSTSEKTHYEDPVTIGFHGPKSNMSLEDEDSKQNLRMFSNDSLKSLSDKDSIKKEKSDDHHIQQPSITSHPDSIKTVKTTEREHYIDLTLQSLHKANMHHYKHYNPNEKNKHKSKFDKKEQSSKREEENNYLKNENEDKRVLSNAGDFPQRPHVRNQQIETVASIPVSRTYSSLLVADSIVQYKGINTSNRLNLDSTLSKETLQRIDISTESLKYFTNKLYYNASDNLKNTSNISPKAAEMPVLYNNQSEGILNGTIKDKFEELRNNRLQEIQNSSNMSFTLNADDFESPDEAEEVFDVSTQCVNLYNNSLYNDSENLSNNGNLVHQNCSNITNSPKAAEIPHPCNNQSDGNENGTLKYNMSEDSNNNVTQTLEDSYNMTNGPKAAETKMPSDNQSVKSSDMSLITTSVTVKNITISSNNSKIMTTTEYNINNRTTEITGRIPPVWDSKTRNTSSSPDSTQHVNTSIIAKDGHKDEEGKQRLTTQKTKLNTQNDKDQILKNLDVVLEGELDAKDIDVNTYDEPEPILKDLNKENIDDRLNDEPGLSKSYVNVKDKKGQELNVVKFNKEYDTDDFKTPRSKLKSKILSAS